MTISHWARHHTFTSPDHATDVVIVGGGFAGLSTAYWISEYRPDLKICILESGACGGSASGRNAGFITKGSTSFYKTLNETWGTKKTKEIYQFASESLALLHQHILQSSPEIKSERTASSTLFQKEDQWDKWKSEKFNPEDFEFKWKPQADLPIDLRSNFFGSYENESEYKVNPLQLISSLKKLLISRKVQILENNSGYHLLADGIQTEVHTIKAKHVVLAMNGYFPQFDPKFKNIIFPRRAQMLAVEMDQSLNCPSIYYDPLKKVYWRQGPDKVLLIGGKRLLDEASEESDFEKVSSVIQEGLESYLKDQLNLKYKVINRWSGIMGFTEHELPIVSKIEAPLDAYMIGGFSGHGMGLGFRSGQEMAELVIGLKKESFFDSIKKTKIKI